MSREATDPAVEKVIATISDEELADRYPDRAHFIAAGNPDQGQLATRALFAGDPVVIVYETAARFSCAPSMSAASPPSS